MQYHNQRSELWFVEAGQGDVNTVIDGKNINIASLIQSDVYTVGSKEVHQLHNTSVTEDLVVIEIQYGEYCDESDIVRL
jgi:mannose-6-phosphate isomerase-like protein (cupin superfamily)